MATAQQQLVRTFANRRVPPPPRQRLRRRPGVVNVPYADAPSETYKVGTDPLYQRPADIAKAKRTTNSLPYTYMAGIRAGRGPGNVPLPRKGRR